EAGADAFYGGLGADTMTGGADAGRTDRFIYFNAVETGVGAGNRDVITDFVSGEDRIELRRIDADITQGFKQLFDFIGDAAFSNTAGELRYEQVGGNTIVQADRPVTWRIWRSN
ncbi:MAG: M10 family metallopeptidase C-terminal domain-containing protein, partial [Roseovarius sp.]